MILFTTVLRFRLDDTWLIIQGWVKALWFKVPVIGNWKRSIALHLNKHKFTFKHKDAFCQFWSKLILWLSLVKCMETRSYNFTHNRLNKKTRRIKFWKSFMHFQLVTIIYPKNLNSLYPRMVYGAWFYWNCTCN